MNSGTSGKAVVVQRSGKSDQSSSGGRMTDKQIVRSFVMDRFKSQQAVLIQCFVKIISTNDEKLRTLTKGSSGFTTRFEIGKEENGCFVFLLLVPKTTREIRKVIKDLKNIQGTEKKSQVTIIMNDARKTEIILQFQYKQHYSYVLKIVKEMLNVYYDRRTYNQKDFIPDRAKILKDLNVNEDEIVKEDNVVIDESPKKKKKNAKKDPIKKKLGISDHISFLSPGISSSTTPFYMVPAQAWNTYHIRIWLSHIYIQIKPGEDKIGTFFDYLQKKKVIKSFLNFLRPTGSMSSSDTQRTVYTAMEQIETFEKKVAKRKIKSISRVIPPSLLKVIKNDFIRNELYYQISILKHNDDMFPIRYFYVLRKQLMHHMKNKQKGTPMLQMYDKKQLNEMRVLWDPEECRDTIFSFLLFHTDLHNLIRSHEIKFYDLLEDESEKLDDDDEPGSYNFEDLDDEDDEEEDERKYPERCDRSSLPIFNQVLKDYNESNNIRLQYISLRVHVDQKRVAHHREWEKEARQVRATLGESIREARSKQQSLMEKMKSIQNGLQKTRDTFSKWNGFPDSLRRTAKLNQIEEQIFEDEDKHKINVDEMKQYGKQVEHLQKSLRKPTTTISSDFTDEYIRKKFFPGFYFSRDRRQAIRSIIVQELSRSDKLSNKKKKKKKKKKKDLSSPPIEEEEEEEEEGQNGMTPTTPSEEDIMDKVAVITTKLVISRRKGKGVGGLYKAGIKLGNAFIPDLFLYGPFHASVLLSNVNLNWFSNSLVFINNLSYTFYYEDCVAIDAYCPLVVNYRCLWNKIQKLADELVYCNVNFRYASYRVLNLDGGQINCQEFTMRLLKILDFTPLFELSSKYLKNLKNYQGSEEEKLRVLHLNDIKKKHEFRKKFKEVWEQVIPSVMYKKNILFFQTHAELDEFVYRCQFLDDDFGLNYPDVYQILKGFDRAFWMMKMNDHRSQRYVEPSENGCPWSKDKVLGIKDLKDKIVQNLGENLSNDDEKKKKKEKEKKRDDDEEEEEEEEGEGED